MNLIQKLEQEEIARLGRKIPDFAPGDTVIVKVQVVEGDKKRERAIMLAGLLGAGMFYGDGMVTPAMSVLSALEGLEVATPVLKPFIIPATLAVLFVLFYYHTKHQYSFCR